MGLGVGLNALVAVQAILVKFLFLVFFYLRILTFGISIDLSQVIRLIDGN